MATVFSLIVMGLYSTTFSQQPASQYAAGLRTQTAKTSAVCNELVEMIQQNEKDPDVILRVGRRFLAQFDGSIAAVESYQKAKTRFGLHSEIDDMVLLYRSLQMGQLSIFTLTDTEVTAPVTEQQVDLVRKQFNEDIVPMAKDFVDRQLGVQGAADFLTDPGFKQAASIVTGRVVSDARSRLEGELRRIVGVRVHLGMSFKDHLLTMARSWVSKSVGNIVLRMAATHFIVEMLAVKLINWIGPKLREVLRNKGNLESRTTRAISGLRERRRDLDSMDSAADIGNVRRFVEAALAHIKADDYLRKDLKRAKRNDLYQKLASEESELLRAVDRAKKRFMLDSPLAKESFGALAAEMRAARAKTAKVLDDFEKRQAAKPLGPDPASKPGAVWQQRETYKVAIGGTWTLKPDGKTFKAKWANGAEADLTLSKCTDTEIVVTRNDLSGVSKGLKATYKGVRKGNRVTGVVSWTWADGRKATGKWSADLPNRIIALSDCRGDSELKTLNGSFRRTIHLWSA